MEIVQQEGEQRQPRTGPGPGLWAEHQQQHRHQEGWDFLQEPGQFGRTGVSSRGAVTAVAGVVLPHLVQQEGHAPHHQSPAQVRHEGIPTLHHRAAGPRRVWN